MHGRACGEHRVRQRWQPRHRADESRETAILGGRHEPARTRARRLQRRQEHARYISARETLRQLTESDYCDGCDSKACVPHSQTITECTIVRG